MQSTDDSTKQQIDSERYEVLQQLEDWLETPMVILGFVWLALLIVDLIWALSPLLEIIGTAIWIIFILDFGLKFTLAPQKAAYLKSNWLTVISLLLPALRIFRITRVVSLLRAASVARGLRLVRIVTSINRGMKALGASMGRRGFGYVIALTGIVILSGAAGMYTFENETRGGLDSYGAALWWTAMLLTSIGSEYWPQTPEGRVLCFILSLYGFAVFGYVTAALAAFFVGRDAECEKAEVAGTKSIGELRSEIAALHADVRTLRSE